MGKLAQQRNAPVCWNCKRRAQRNHGSYALLRSQLQRNCDRLGSLHKETLLLPRGDHVVTEDVERRQVFAAVAKFLAKQMPA